MRSIKLVLAAAALALVAAAAARADGWGPATPNFNLEVILRPAAGASVGGFGHVTFRQPKDEAKIIYLDTWVRDLAPNHAYVLQRAVDTTVNDECASTAWLSLGEVNTDDGGTGRAALTRDVSMIPTGREFDIHFQVIDKTTSAVVLESSCYQFVVSQ
jgi:hypothetical protein